MKNDQRRHPRVARKIRVRPHAREAVELETIDLSVGGFSCTAPAFLAPMTKMAVSLVLPPDAGTGQSEDQTVHGEAVVVRTEPGHAASHANGGYRIALFFSRMDDEDRRRLARYLSAHAEKDDR